MTAPWLQLSCTGDPMNINKWTYLSLCYGNYNILALWMPEIQRVGFLCVLSRASSYAINWLVDRYSLPDPCIINPLLFVFERPFVKLFAICYQTVVCPVDLSVCDVGILWQNGWMDQDETRHAGRPRPWPHCVRWGPSSPPPKGEGRSPQFSAHICCTKNLGATDSQMAGWIKMPLGMEVGLNPGDFVLDGDPALPSPKMGAEPPPQFSAHFYCGQTATIPLHASWCHLVLR